MYEELIESIFNKIDDSKKTVVISPNLLLDLSDLKDVKDILNFIDSKIEEFFGYKNDNEYTLYQEFLDNCSLLKDFINKKADTFQAYIDYGNNNGFFFKATTIEFFKTYIFLLEDLISSSFLESNPGVNEEALLTKEIVLRNTIHDYLKDQKFIKIGVEFTSFARECSVKEQLGLYDFSNYDSIVIGCARGLEDRSIIDHNHSCHQNHKNSSLMLDLMGYGHNSDIVGFDALEIKHWEEIHYALRGKKISSVIDHTGGLFNHEDILIENYQKNPSKLYQVAQFIKDNILTLKGNIFCFYKESSFDVEIDSKYFQNQNIMNEEVDVLSDMTTLTGVSSEIDS
jgi:hypothetical protein